MVGKGKIAKGGEELEFLFTGGCVCCCCVIPAFILIGFAFNGHHTPETMFIASTGACSITTGGCVLAGCGLHPNPTSLLHSSRSLASGLMQHPK